MNIDLHPDTLDDITRQNLISLRDGFKEDLKKERPNVFHVEPLKDKKEIKKYISRLNFLIKYLGGK